MAHVKPRPTFAAAGVAMAGLLLAGCSVNPATGKQQINLIGEDKEVQMGREADPQIVASMGLYEDGDVQAYVQQLGKSIAARSERPELPWTFRVLDDPAVNAFALPGGYIYVTRGIMTHMNDEAELVSVLGHEIGHVTARHSVNQMSKTQLANIGGIGLAIFKPELMNAFGNVVGAGMQLMFLKYSRDDERQADELGLRYLQQSGYDARHMAEVFEMLERVGGEGDSGRMPGWMATHPSPGNRAQTVNAALQGGNFQGTKVNTEQYMQRLDGMVFGPNPREGFFRDALFLHPDMKFQFRFPEGWKAQNTRQAVAAISPNKDAMIQVQLAEGKTAQEAANKFFQQEGLRAGAGWTRSIGGIPAVTGSFAAKTEQAELQGLAVFLEHGGHVFQILGYGVAQNWGQNDGPIEASLSSFARLTDPSALNVQPQRVDVVRAPRDMTLSSFESSYPSKLPIEKLALINGLAPNERIASGQLVKRIVS